MIWGVGVTKNLARVIFRDKVVQLSVCSLVYYVLRDAHVKKSRRHERDIHSPEHFLLEAVCIPFSYNVHKTDDVRRNRSETARMPRTRAAPFCVASQISEKSKLINKVFVVHIIHIYLQ